MKLIVIKFKRSVRGYKLGMVIQLSEQDYERKIRPYFREGIDYVVFAVHEPKAEVHEIEETKEEPVEAPEEEATVAEEVEEPQDAESNTEEDDFAKLVAINGIGESTAAKILEAGYTYESFISAIKNGDEQAIELIPASQRKKVISAVEEL